MLSHAIFCSMQIIVNRGTGISGHSDDCGGGLRIPLIFLYHSLDLNYHNLTKPNLTHPSLI